MSVSKFAIGCHDKTSIKYLGCGGGLVVSVRAFYTDDPSSNPAGDLNFQYEKKKKKEAGVGPSLKKLYTYID